MSVISIALAIGTAYLFYKDTMNSEELKILQIKVNETQDSLNNQVRFKDSVILTGLYQEADHYIILLESESTKLFHETVIDLNEFLKKINSYNQRLNNNLLAKKLNKIMTGLNAKLKMPVADAKNKETRRFIDEVVDLENRICMRLENNCGKQEIEALNNFKAKLNNE